MRLISALFLVLALTFTHAQWNLPSVGSNAPDFTLYNYNTGDSVTLSDYEGDQTVVLVFGSFT
jgi:hypothetical protein